MRRIDTKLDSTSGTTPRQSREDPPLFPHEQTRPDLSMPVGPRLTHIRFLVVTDARRQFSKSSRSRRDRTRPGENVRSESPYQLLTTRRRYSGPRSYYSRFHHHYPPLYSAFRDVRLARSARSSVGSSTDADIGRGRRERVGDVWPRRFESSPSTRLDDAILPRLSISAHVPFVYGVVETCEECTIRSPRGPLEFSCVRGFAETTSDAVGRRRTTVREMRSCTRTICIASVSLAMVAIARHSKTVGVGDTRRLRVGLSNTPTTCPTPRRRYATCVCTETYAQRVLPAAVRSLDK